MSIPRPPRRVAFYFSAHQDDWQLFMNPPAFRDVLDDSVRCVFVHMTAGDAGLGLGTGGRRQPLYRAREHGAECAIRFMADASNRPPATPEIDVPTVAGRAVRRIVYRNTVTYFLRLPDGNPDGTGYAATGFQSLKRLCGGESPVMTAVDGSASYRGWTDLTATLGSLIAAECGDVRLPELHVPEADPHLNPGDHADHLFTARAVCDASRDRPSRVVHHVGYASGSRPENLVGADRDMKCAVYAVTLAGVLAFDHPVSWEHYDALYVGRHYERSETVAPA